VPVTLLVNQVSLIGNAEPHRRIQLISGPVGQQAWHHTQEQAIEYIESRLFSYYLVKDSRAVRLIVGQTAAGEKFLKAEPDGDTPDLLLQLPSRLREAESG
jgi:hypothetical protein